jgi:hypothetical protein
MLKAGVSDPLKKPNFENEHTKAFPTDGEEPRGIF